MNTADNNRTRKIKRLENLFYDGDMRLVIAEAIKLGKEYKSATVYNILALAYKGLGDYNHAMNIYEKLLQSNPTNVLFLGNLGNIYSDIGQLDNVGFLRLGKPP